MSLNAITRMYDPKEQNPVFFFLFLTVNFQHIEQLNK